MSVAKQASRIGLATLASRLFGLIREQVFAALLGAGFYSDCFFIAFRIPNLLRDLFAEGSLSQAFVPVFSKARAVHGTERAFELTNRVIAVLTVIVGTLVILGIVFAPTVVHWLAPGFGSIEGKLELTILLTRIMFPFLWLVSIAAVFMGVLNVFKHFSIPALAPVLFNVSSIVVGLVLWKLGAQGRTAVIGWSVGTLIGGLLQAAVQFPSAWKLGYRPKAMLQGNRSDPYVKQIGKLMGPAVIANAGTQVNVLVNTILSSLLAQGAASWLNYAFRLMQFPLGLFGVSLATVTLTQTSELASLNQEDRIAKSLSSSLRLALLLTLPCVVAFWMIGAPIVQLIYQRGAFDLRDSYATTHALSMYAAGLPFYAAVRIVAPTFFALGKPYYSMAASLTGIMVNIVFNLMTYQVLGHGGLAFGTSLGMTANFLLLILFLKKQGIAFAKQDFLSLVTPTVLALFALALTTCLMHVFHNRWMILPVCALSALSYGIVLQVFKVREFEALTLALKKRLFKPE